MAIANPQNPPHNGRSETKIPVSPAQNTPNTSKNQLSLENFEDNGSTASSESLGLGRLFNEFSLVGDRITISNEVN